ncbi:MAG: hypothetical protein IJV06_07605 [Bacteroidaceae bacterium]|nr:hypothetical protein [Bacteroidaceae bacterium]
MMTALQLNAEIYRTMAVIADDETLLSSALKSLKRLAAKKKDETLMTKQEFFDNVEEAERQIACGESVTFTNLDDMNQWLNSL